MTAKPELPDEIWAKAPSRLDGGMYWFKGNGPVTKYIRADLAARTEAPATQAEDECSSCAPYIANGMSNSGCVCQKQSAPTATLTERIEGLKRPLPPSKFTYVEQDIKAWNAALDAVLEACKELNTEHFNQTKGN